jgi:signal transduction histidine kinase
MLDFTELVATAIANAESRSELAASRARIVAASDETRRRVERDLHDGTQQRLVTLALELRSAQADVPPHLEDVQAELSRVGQGLVAVLEELREISRGIHPAILAEGGLVPALKTLARRSPIPVELDNRCDGRLPDSIERAAYYAVSEMLTNAAKHAQASTVYVDVERADGLLHVSVRDDGVGGADPARGSGLVGLRDRVEVLGGTIAVHSPNGGGTAIEVTVPLDRTPI